MSHIEKKIINEREYDYFVKKISFMNHLFIIKKNMGANSPLINKEKYLLDNLNELSEEELRFRVKFLKYLKSYLSYNENLPERTELKSIKINNLLEGKKCEKELYIEFAKEFIFNSNNIEGSKIPPEKVREIIERGDTTYNNRNEVKEVKNSILAFEYLKKSFKFNLISIKRLYHILTKNLLMQGNTPYPRGFKKEENIVGNSETIHPEKVEEELSKLLKWYRENKNKIHPLRLAFEFHKQYEFIHPFTDGNGRTGRLIMNKILMNFGYSPIIVYKGNKSSYFNYLKKAINKNPKAYYQFMLEQADKTYDFLLETIKRY